MNDKILELENKAKKIRRKIIEVSFNANTAHISSSLSIVDILTVLYWDVLKINPKKLNDANRDRFILSKGHAVTALYAVLYYKKILSEELISSYGKNGTLLAGHPEHLVPGIELSTGSLGHGLSVGAGIAYANKIDNRKSKVYVLLSDAECQEGTIWESVLFSSHFKLNNLVAIIDYNKVQAFGKTNKVINLEPFAEKWKSFGWDVAEINGHNIKLLNKQLNKTSSKNKPRVIICHTVAGKGVSFMENKILWHYHNLTELEYKQALKELSI